MVNKFCKSNSLRFLFVEWLFVPKAMGNPKHQEVEETVVRRSNRSLMLFRLSSMSRPCRLSSKSRPCFVTKDYEMVMEVLKDYSAERIDLKGVGARLKALFKGHNNLI